MQLNVMPDIYATTETPDVYGASCVLTDLDNDLNIRYKTKLNLIFTNFNFIKYCEFKIEEMYKGGDLTNGYLNCEQYLEPVTANVNGATVEGYRYILYYYSEAKAKTLNTSQGSFADVPNFKIDEINKLNFVVSVKFDYERYLSDNALTYPIYTENINAFIVALFTSIGKRYDGFPVRAVAVHPSVYRAVSRPYTVVNFSEDSLALEETYNSYKQVVMNSVLQKKVDPQIYFSETYFTRNFSNQQLNCYFYFDKNKLLVDTLPSTLLVDEQSSGFNLKLFRYQLDDFGNKQYDTKKELTYTDKGLNLYKINNILSDVPTNEFGGKYIFEAEVDYSYNLYQQLDTIVNSITAIYNLIATTKDQAELYYDPVRKNYSGGFNSVIQNNLYRSNIFLRNVINKLINYKILAQEEKENLLNIFDSNKISLESINLAYDAINYIYKTILDYKNASNKFSFSLSHRFKQSYNHEFSLNTGYKIINKQDFSLFLENINEEQQLLSNINSKLSCFNLPATQPTSYYFSLKSAHFNSLNPFLFSNVTVYSDFENLLKENTLKSKKQFFGTEKNLNIYSNTDDSSVNQFINKLQSYASVREYNNAISPITTGDAPNALRYLKTSESVQIQSMKDVFLTHYYGLEYYLGGQWNKYNGANTIIINNTLLSINENTLFRLKKFSDPSNDLAPQPDIMMPVYDEYFTAEDSPSPFSQLITPPALEQQVDVPPIDLSQQTPQQTINDLLQQIPQPQPITNIGGGTTSGAISGFVGGLQNSGQLTSNQFGLTNPTTDLLSGFTSNSFQRSLGSSLQSSLVSTLG